MADRGQHPSREDEIRRAVFDQVDLQTAELEIDGSIYDGFSAAIMVKGQPRTVALTREYSDAVQLIALIERGRSAQRKACNDAQPAILPTDDGGCVTKRFVIFTTPGRVPEKKGGWLKEEHLIDFLRDVMLHDKWKPGFRATVLELTWDNDVWASSATEYLSMHDHALGPRRARKAWLEARAKHERIYKMAPKMKLGDEIDNYIKTTSITHPAPDALRAEIEMLEEVCARYADDEDAFLSSDGEPFGSITTECGLKARAARTRFKARLADPQSEQKGGA